MIIRKRSQNWNRSDSIHRYVDTKRGCLTNGHPWKRCGHFGAHLEIIYIFHCSLIFYQNVGDMIFWKS